MVFRCSPRGIQRAEVGLFSVTEVSPGIYHSLHQDFTGWIDLSPLGTEKVNKRERVCFHLIIAQNNIPSVHRAKEPLLGLEPPSCSKCQVRPENCRLGTADCRTPLQQPSLHQLTVVRQCRKCTPRWACISRWKQQEQSSNASLVTVLLTGVERPTGSALRVSFSGCWMHTLLSHWPWQGELAGTLQAGDRERKKTCSLN